jgi:CMP-N-acetylneuraminic acid synthetase
VINGLKVVGLIPAKGNSKTIPRKNLLPFRGRTLVENTILNAKKSRYIDEIIVNSDDIEILNQSSSLGVRVFHRDAELATDATTANQLLENFFMSFNSEDNFYILYLQPTSPLRTTDHIDSICQNLESSTKKCAISVTEIDNKILKSFIKIDENLVPISKNRYLNMNRQALPKVFMSNGAAYLFRKSDFLLNNEIPMADALAFVMDSDSSLDIDTLKDYRELLKLDSQ